MKFSKIIALLLVLSMLVLILPACSKDTVGDTETTAAADGTTAETTAETAVETPVPETTEEVTEAPKVYEYTTVFELDFSKMADGAAPFTANGIDNLRIEGGLLKGTSNGVDPYMPYTGGDAMFPAESVQIIEIKYMNYSINYNLQLFFTTETIGWAEEASIKATLDWSADDGEDNDWNIIQLTASDSAEWMGNITNFRIDPFSDVGDFEIAYIKFMSMTEVGA